MKKLNFKTSTVEDLFNAMNNDLKDNALCDILEKYSPELYKEFDENEEYLKLNKMLDLGYLSHLSEYKEYYYLDFAYENWVKILFNTPLNMVVNEVINQLKIKVDEKIKLLKEDINEYVSNLSDIKFDDIEDYLNLELNYKEEGKYIKYVVDLNNDMNREGFYDYMEDINYLNINKYDDEDLYNELYKYFKDKMKEMYYTIYKKAGYDNIEENRNNDDIIYLIKIK